MRFRIVDSIDAIDAACWDACVPGDYPFLQHAFLAALERSGSVCSATGWRAQHIVIETDAALVALVPLYVKTHSYGEYVFDWSWAEAYQRHRVPYYPKLVMAVPFTPAMGPRVASRLPSAEWQATLDQALQSLSAQWRASGWHVLFTPDDELLWRDLGADHRLGCHFQWFNDGYANFDAFLATFTSKRRKTVRRERTRVAEQGVEVRRLAGDAITPEVWERFDAFYRLTYLKRSGHEGYLTPAFFEALHTGFRDRLLLVCAWRDGQLIAGALNVMSRDTLYGRYWGALEEVDCLHFELCYYQGIEWCIENKVQRYDPGVQGEHKIPRGFRPILTSSWHRLHHPAFRDAVARFLVQECEQVCAYREQASEALPFHRDGA